MQAHSTDRLPDLAGQLLDAIRAGNCSGIRQLIEQGALTGPSLVQRPRFAEVAASLGQIHTLELLAKARAPITNDSWVAAVRNGEVACANFVAETGTQLDPAVIPELKLPAELRASVFRTVFSSRIFNPSILEIDYCSELWHAGIRNVDVLVVDLMMRHKALSQEKTPTLSSEDSYIRARRSRGNWFPGLLEALKQSSDDDIRRLESVYRLAGLKVDCPGGEKLLRSALAGHAKRADLVVDVLLRLRIDPLLLLDAGLDPSYRSANGRNIVSILAGAGAQIDVAALTEIIDVDNVDAAGRSAFHHASLYNTVWNGLALLKAGAPLGKDIPCQFEKTVALRIIETCRPEVILECVKAGVDLNERTVIHGRSAAFFALVGTEFDRFKCVLGLVGAGSTDFRGNTLLHVAAGSGSPDEVILELLAHPDIDVFAKNYDGQTALECAGEMFPGAGRLIQSEMRRLNIDSALRAILAGSASRLQPDVL